MTSGMVKPSAFRLLSPSSESGPGVGQYVWGGKTSVRFFCTTCGVHCFGKGHLAEVGGDYVSINLSCIDDIDPRDLTVIYWDGRHDNWHAGPSPSPWPVHAGA